MTRYNVSVLALGAALCLAAVHPAAAQQASPAAAAQASDPRATFERLKSLAGTWEGQAGDEKSTPPATVVYRVASGGTVVQETLFPGTPHEMISMYHMADGNLVMTHYCAVGNQPRMKLDDEGVERRAPGVRVRRRHELRPAKDPHIHSGVIEIKGDALRNEWASWQGGKEARREIFVLHRKN